MVCCHVPHFTIQKTVDRVDWLLPDLPDLSVTIRLDAIQSQELSCQHLLIHNKQHTSFLKKNTLHRSYRSFGLVKCTPLGIVQLSDVLSLSRQSIQFSRKCDTIFHTASLTRGFIAKVRDFWDHETFRLLTKVFGVKKHDETLRVIPRSSDSNIKQKLTTLQVLSVKNVKSLLIFFV